jgi:hypothetical protein
VTRLGEWFPAATRSGPSGIEFPHPEATLTPNLILEGVSGSLVVPRLETSNTFNHPQWNGINVGCNRTNPDGTPAFDSRCTGLVNGLLNGEVTSAFPPRNLQFALKLIF